MWDKSLNDLEKVDYPTEEAETETEKNPNFMNLLLHFTYKYLVEIVQIKSVTSTLTRWGQMTSNVSIRMDLALSGIE